MSWGPWKYIADDNGWFVVGNGTDGFTGGYSVGVFIGGGIVSLLGRLASFMVVAGIFLCWWRRGPRGRLIRRIFRLPRGRLRRGIWQGLFGLHDGLPLGLLVGSFEGPSVEGHSRIRCGRKPRSGVPTLESWSDGTREKSAGSWWMEEEEGHHRKATQINSVAGTGKGRGRPGRRIGLAPKVPSYWETRRGRRGRGSEWRAVMHTAWPGIINN